MFLILALVYAALSAAAFAIFVDGWRRTFDVDRGDVVLFVIFSVLGPISLVAAVIIWLIGALAESDSPVIWKRK